MGGPEPDHSAMEAAGEGGRAEVGKAVRAYQPSKGVQRSDADL